MNWYQALSPNKEMCISSINDVVLLDTYSQLLPRKRLRDRSKTGFLTTIQKTKKGREAKKTPPRQDKTKYPPPQYPCLMGLFCLIKTECHHAIMMFIRTMPIWNRYIIFSYQCWLRTKQYRQPRPAQQ